MKDMNRRHEQELKTMQQKIHMNTDAAFNRFKEAAQQIMSQKLAQPITNKQVCHRNWPIQSLTNRYVTETCPANH